MDSVICIPTVRPPPILTLDAYKIPAKVHVLVVADPDLYDRHVKYYSGHDRITVVGGMRGNGAQTRQCYIEAALYGYRTFLRLDDDLPIGSFLTKDGYATLEFVLKHMQSAMEELDVTLVGLVNTSRRNWLGTGYKRTYGMIHGGANLAISSENPDMFIDPVVVRGCDIYQTCAHRLYDIQRGHDGSVGRVAFIGLDKHLSTTNSCVSSDDRTREENRKYIMNKFPEMFSVFNDSTVRLRRLKK